MEVFNRGKRHIKLLLVVAMLIAFGMAAGCQDFQQFPPATPPTQQPQPEPVTLPTTITTEDRAILAVYEYLLSQAENNESKLYLAEFYTVCDNWSARLERFKDGSTMWYVVVDMTGEPTWEWRQHWRQAGWFILKGNNIIPSNRLQANALRIEADLYELSLRVKPEAPAD